MSFVSSVLLGFLAGVIVIVVLPLVVGRLLPRRLQHGLGGWYFELTMKLYGRALLILPENGIRPTIKPSKFDDAAGGETTRLDGAEKSWRDPGGKMGQFKGKPFGIARADSNVIITPQDMEVGEQLARHEANDNLELKSRVPDGDDGSNLVDWVNGWFKVPAGPRIVDPLAARKVVDGSADPGIATRIRTFVENSQKMFDRSQTLQQLMWLAAGAAGFGLPVLAQRVLSGSGGGGGIDLPIGGLIDIVVVGLL